MEAIINFFTGTLNTVAWLYIFLPCTIVGGLYLTIRNRGIQFTRFGYAMKNTVGKMFQKQEAGAGAVTPLQAVTTALAATVGTGNIVGTSQAIALGGYGAVFWLWLAALLGMMIKYSEVTLSIQYRERDAKGDWVGGPMYYVKNGLGKHWQWVGILFCVFAAIASFGIGNMGQINKIVLNMKSAFFGGVTATVGGMSVVSLACGIVLMILAALIVIGGLQRIATVAERVVPFMAVLYIIGSLIVFFTHISSVGAMFAAIFRFAFGSKAVAGGAAGIAIQQAITQGCKRGVFSNEAGLGSLAVLHGMSEGKGRLRQRQEAQKQGMWAIFEVFFDTIIGCSLTAFLLLCVFPHNLTEKIDSLGGSGAVAAALAARFGNAGGIVTAACMVLFAFATILAWFYIGDQALGWLMRDVPQKRADKICILYHGGYLASVFLGCVSRMEAVWAVSDIFNGLMAVPNLAALVLLGRKVRRPER